MFELKDHFHTKFPAPRTPTRRSSSGASLASAAAYTGRQDGSAASAAAPRVSGQCDYTVDSEPLDLSRVISLPSVSARDFAEKRPGNQG